MTLEQIDLIKRLVSQYPTHLQVARKHSMSWSSVNTGIFTSQFVKDSDRLLEVHGDGRTASLISVESGHSIGTSLPVLRMFHRLGAVSLTLTHNCNTPW